MKKSIFRFNYVFLFTAALMFCMQAQAQVPKIDVSAGKMNPALKKEAERRAVVQKTLNATVSKVEFWMKKIPSSGNSYALFNDRRISLKENNGNFVLAEQIVGLNKIFTYGKEFGKPFDESYSFTPKTTVRYKDLLDNGLTVNIDFTKRVQNGGTKFDCFFIFYFTDGTQQTVSLQEMNLTKEGMNVVAANAEVHISKNFPSVFPDPDNPLVLPAVK